MVIFATVQLVLAGNDTEGLRYGVIETRERYFMTWKEDGAPGMDAADLPNSPLDRALMQVCEKRRLLELIHDFMAYDAGTKKTCRPNQYFGVRAAQDHIHRGQGGIIWHTQGSGKSLTMVWLARWIREHVPEARVLLVTDRTELDGQIEGVFQGVREDIYRTRSGADLIEKLAAASPWLICSLVHKFAGGDSPVGDGFAEELRRTAPPDFTAHGRIFVFVDECHRTQTGALHRAMKAILPGAVFIGFTGTPLLKADRGTSIEAFGPYIHTYKFDEAVRDRVVLDLRYEARDIDQTLTSPGKVDHWFEAKTKGLTDLARAQLKQRWGTLQKVLSSRSRLEQIVDDILMDMATKDRLRGGHGNAMLVSGSIYQACRLYQLFEQTDLAGKCAIVTSYRPSHNDLKGETTGEGLTERLRQHDVYTRMLGGKEPDKFEEEVKARFIKEPGQMKLSIVVDKLLTGFDAPPATYLYIDKQMRDHGLFQAICRVNRLDGDDKDYGYIVDYKDLFRSLETSVHDYTSGALDGYEAEDVAGLLSDRLVSARARLDDAREAVRALCEPVALPRGTPEHLRFFGCADTGDKAALKEAEPQRLALYRLAAGLLRAYAEVAGEMAEAGYTEAEAAAVRADVTHFEKVRGEVKIASADYIDLKAYEPAMRHLIDAYIKAGDSEVISRFDNLPLVNLIVERGAAAVEALPEGLRGSTESVAETIENNIRRVITDETPVNPRYYASMSGLLDALIAQRRQGAVEYEAYLARVVELARQVQAPGTGTVYPAVVNTSAKQALYDNLDQDEALAVALDATIRATSKDGWRGNAVKEREVRRAIRQHISDEKVVSRMLELVRSRREY